MDWWPYLQSFLGYHTYPAISSSGQSGEVSLRPKLQMGTTRSRDAENLIPTHTVCEQQSQGCLLVAQLCSTLCNPTDGSPPGSSVHGASQARILEWGAISFSRGSFQARSWTWVSALAGRFFTIWAAAEPTADQVCLLVPRHLRCSLIDTYQGSLVTGRTALYIGYVGCWLH